MCKCVVFWRENFQMKNKTKERNILVVMVHGTNLLSHFKDIPWPPKDSKLVRTITEYFASKPNIKLQIDKDFYWKGRNSDHARKQAGKQLAAYVDELVDAENADFDEVYLVSHSHGFIVCDRSIPHLGTKATKLLNGLAVFNAPNINSLKRDFVRNFERNIRSLVPVLLIISIFMGSVNVYALHEYYIFDIDSNFLEKLPILLNYLPFILMSAFIIFACLFLWLNKTCVRRMRIAGRQIQRNPNTPDLQPLPPRNVSMLQINSSGDEAWNVLSIWGSLSQFPFYLTHKTTTRVIFVTFLMSYIIYTPSWIGTPSNEFWYNCVYSIAESIQKLDPTGYIIRKIVTQNDLLSIINASGCFAEILKFGVYIFSAMLAATLLTMIGFLIGYLMNFFYERLGLGYRFWERLPGFLMSRKFVEILPHNYKKIYFFDSGIGSTGINHSAGYEDKRAILKICTWIRQKGRL